MLISEAVAGPGGGGVVENAISPGRVSSPSSSSLGRGGAVEQSMIRFLQGGYRHPLPEGEEQSKIRFLQGGYRHLLPS